MEPGERWAVDLRNDFEDEDDDEYEDDWAAALFLKTDPSMSGTTRPDLRLRGSRSKDRRRLGNC